MTEPTVDDGLRSQIDSVTLQIAKWPPWKRYELDREIAECRCRANEPKQRRSIHD